MPGKVLVSSLRGKKRKYLVVFGVVNLSEVRHIVVVIPRKARPHWTTHPNSTVVANESASAYDCLILDIIILTPGHSVRLDSPSRSIFYDVALLRHTPLRPDNPVVHLLHLKM